MTADAAEVIASCGLHRKDSTNRAILAALAAACAEHGVVTAEVECPRCWGKPAADVMPCALCGDTGTVRVVVHLADPALADRLDAIAIDNDHEGERQKLAAAARIVAGEA